VGICFGLLMICFESSPARKYKTSYDNATSLFLSEIEKTKSTELYFRDSNDLHVQPLRKFFLFSPQVQPARWPMKFP
jgi:hypothetical protein